MKNNQIYLWTALLLYTQNRNAKHQVSTLDCERAEKLSKQLDLEVPITRAEFIIGIIQAMEIPLEPVADTHYALPAMYKAEELELIERHAYEMHQWSHEMPKREKLAILKRIQLDPDLSLDQILKGLNQMMVTAVTVEGKPVDLEGDPIKHYKGHVMIPLEPVAEAMGFKTSWNPMTYTMTLSNEKIMATVQVGLDLYVYSSVQAIGMTAPMSIGVPPIYVEETIYVPIEYFNLFATYEINNGILNYTMKIND